MECGGIWRCPLRSTMSALSSSRRSKRSSTRFMMRSSSRSELICFCFIGKQSSARGTIDQESGQKQGNRANKRAKALLPRFYLQNPVRCCSLPQFQSIIVSICIICEDHSQTGVGFSLKNRVLSAAPKKRISVATMYPIESRKGPKERMFQTKMPMTVRGANTQKKMAVDFVEFLKAWTETSLMYSKAKIMRVASTNPTTFLVVCFHMISPWVCSAISLKRAKNHSLAKAAKMVTAAVMMTVPLVSAVQIKALRPSTIAMTAKRIHSLTVHASFSTAQMPQAAVPTVAASSTTIEQALEISVSTKKFRCILKFLARRAMLMTTANKNGRAKQRILPVVLGCEINCYSVRS